MKLTSSAAGEERNFSRAESVRIRLNIMVLGAAGCLVMVFYRDMQQNVDAV